mgnify:CR=1 FL=1
MRRLGCTWSCVFLSLLMGAGCASDTSGDKPTPAAEAPKRHRFEIALDDGGDGAMPLPLWRFQSKGRDVVLAATYRGTTATNACNATLVGALQAADVFYRASSETFAQNNTLLEVLNNRTTEDDATFQKRVEALLSTPEAKQKWQAFLKEQAALKTQIETKLGRLPAAIRDKKLKELNLDKVLQLQTFSVMSLRGIYDSHPQWSKCMNTTVPNRPYDRLLEFDDATRTALVQLATAGLDAAATAEHVAGAMESTDTHVSPKLKLLLGTVPFSLPAFEELHASPSPNAEARKTVSNHLRALVLGDAHPQQHLMLEVDPAELAGDNGLLQQLVDAGVELRQLHSASVFAPRPPLATATMQVKDLQRTTRAVTAQPMTTRTIWQTDADANRKMTRLTPRLMQFMTPAAEPGGKAQFTTWRIDGDTVEPLDVPSDAHSNSAQDNLAVFARQDDGSFIVVDLDTQKTTPLEGGTRLVARDGQTPWMVTAKGDPSSGVFAVRFAPDAPPVDITVRSPWGGFPSTRTVDGGLLFDIDVEEGGLACRMLFLRPGDDAATCVAPTEKAAKRMWAKLAGYAVGRFAHPDDPTSKVSAVVDHHTGRRVLLPGTGWRVMGSGGAAALGLARLMRDVDAEPALYVDNTLWSVPGVLQFCRVQQGQLSCAWRENAKAPRDNVVVDFKAGVLRRAPAQADPKDPSTRTQLVVDDVQFTALPSCAKGWRLRQRKGDWAHATCWPADMKNGSATSGVLHLPTATFFQPTHNVAYVDDDGHVLLSDGEVSERRRSISKLLRADLNAQLPKQ